VTPTQRTVLGWGPAILWFALIFVLSSQPSLPSPSQISDKQAHALTYGVLAVLCLMGLTGWNWRRVAGAGLLGAFVIAVLYGVSDEFHQSFVAGRTPDAADVLADAVGAALALTVAWGWAILVGRRCSIPRC
jgi:VanZ family protein